MLSLKLSKFRINKIKASVLVILIVVSAFVSLSGFFHFASASASGSPQPLGLTLVVTSANHPLVIGETLGLRADVVVPTHNESFRDWDFWTTHSKVVSDYNASAFTFVWQTEQSSSASSVDSWNLTSTGVNADFQFTKLTAEPLNVTVSVVYGSQGVIALSSIQVVPASQPKTLQVSIVTPLGNDPKLSVNQVLDCSANVTALNQFGNETFMVSLSDALFTYTITAHNTTVLSVNGLQSTFEAYQPVTLASSNGILSLAYASASEAEVWVHLQVTGNNQSSLLFNQTAGYTLVVTDPYTSPFMYFVASTATASYIITTDGLGWYRAVNGTDGSISWSSTNLVSVIQNAQNALTPNRNCKETIVLVGNLGEINNIVLANYTIYQGYEASLTVNGNFGFVQPDSDLTNVEFKNIVFSSATGHNTAIELFHYTNPTWRNAANITVSGCTFTNFGNGIHTISTKSKFSGNTFNNNSLGLYFDAGSLNIISGNTFTIPNYYIGMRLTDTGDNTVTGNTFYGMATIAVGIQTRAAGNIAITGNTFAEMAEGYGIVLDGDSGSYGGSPPILSKDISITGNTFDTVNIGVLIGYTRNNTGINISGCLSNFGVLFIVGRGSELCAVGNTITSHHGFELSGSDYKVNVQANTFTPTYDPIIGSGLNNIKNNVGFVTENSFSGANTTATTAVLNHGLASAATFVWVSFDSAAITGYTWSSTETQVTITPTGTLPASWTCYVKAEYKP